MNFLMVMPRIVNKPDEAYQFPLGLPYVSAALKSAGFNVFTVNLNHYSAPVDEILKNMIEKHHIDVVMTGGLSFQFWNIYQILEGVKNYNANLMTIVGGGIITGDPETAMKALEFADIGVIGEGEITVPELCGRLEGGKGFEDVAGLIWKNDKGVFIKSAPRSPVPDLDALPWPDFDGFELEKTFASNAGISGLNTSNTIYMLASRSCPFQCSFCFHTVGNKYRQRSLDSFFAELDFYVKRYHIKYVCVEDELISYDSKRIQEFCRRIKEYHIGWWTQFRVDMVEPWLIPLLKESGCDIMSFGLESADNRVLKSMGKHITVEQIESTFSKVVDFGMHFEGAFIFGDTAETYETANNTLSFWLRHPEYRINLNSITIFPGSPLYKRAVTNGTIEDPVRYLREGCPQINMSQMTKLEFNDILTKSMEYPHKYAKRLERSRVLDVDYSGARVSLEGTCETCGEKNVWENIRLFKTNALACPRCGQRYNVFCPQELYPVFLRNVQLLLAHGNVAVWGVNYVTTKLFLEIDALSDKRITLIDSSSIKQDMRIGEQIVRAPSIITDKEISVVVIGIPAYFYNISLQIQHMYPVVRQIIDISDLIREDFESVITYLPKIKG